MKHYILNLEGCLEETAEWIIQNIRFWCIEIKQRGESAIYDITSSCDFNSTRSFFSPKVFQSIASHRHDRR